MVSCNDICCKNGTNTKPLLQLYLQYKHITMTVIYRYNIHI